MSRAPLLQLLAGLSLALLAAAPGGAQRPRQEKASLALEADRTAYAPGSRARIAAVVSIDRGWHVNSNRPTFDYLIATEVDFTAPPGWKTLSIDYPPGEIQSFAFADQPLSVYDGEIAVIGSLEVPPSAEPGSFPVRAELTYQACDDRSCLPPVTTSAEIELTVGPGGRPANSSRFAAGGGGAGGGGGLPLMLLLGLAGGLILNLMPCVLPVLSLKVFGFVKSAGQGRPHVVFGSLATAAGILISFWALALAAVGARAAGGAVGWGIQFQEPVFVSFLAILVILFSLNLWGLFEIPLPAFLGRVASRGPHEGLPGHLASGLFATLMATPCSAPFLGTAVGFALSQPAGTILAIFTAVGTGMALPYFVLAAAPGAARLLPRPGAWMDRLKGIMGFLLAGAAVWLFYVLAAQMSTERLAFIQLSLLALALCVWLRARAGDRTARLAATGGALATAALAVTLAAGAEGGAAPSAPAASAAIPWVAFDRQEAERLADEGRLVFVDVTADWCFTCKVNERLVLERPEIAALFERRGVVPMKADWTNRSDAIADFLAEHGRYGIPFYLLYRPGAPPHLFGEILTVDEVIEVVERSLPGAPAGSSGT